MAHRIIGKHVFVINFASVFNCFDELFDVVDSERDSSWQCADFVRYNVIDAYRGSIIVWRVAYRELVLPPK